MQMGLRDSLKKSLRSVFNRLSGEYSAAETEIRPDTGQDPQTATDTTAKVTRARLRRPPGE